MFKHGETVTRERGQLVADPYSGEASSRDWTDPETLPVEGAAIGPSSTTEQAGDDRLTVTSSMSLYCQSGLDIEPHDRIRARSGLWDVVGEEQVWINPFSGWAPGSEYQLRKVLG